MQQIYYEKLIKVCQRVPQLMHKDVSELWDIAGNMADGKYRKNHMYFKLISSR